MEHGRSAVSAVENNPGRCVTVMWYLTVLLCAINVIVSITVAAKNDNSTSGSHAAAFAAIWTLFLLLIVCVTGTAILHRYHSPLAVGVFMGMSTMMSQLMLVLFGVFVALSHDASGNEKNSDQAFAAFAFVLFILFLIFSIVLSRYRTTVMRTADMTGKDAIGVGGWSTNAAPTDSEVPAPPPQGTPV